MATIAMLNNQRVPNGFLDYNMGIQASTMCVLDGYNSF